MRPDPRCFLSVDQIYEESGQIRFEIQSSLIC